MHHMEIEMDELSQREPSVGDRYINRKFIEALDREFVDALDRMNEQAIKEAAALDCTADRYLQSAADEMADRAASRDAEDGERSMARAVEAFNALYGQALTVTEGWQFMSILKKARGAQGAYCEDDYVDDIAYAALAAEEAANEW